MDLTMIYENLITYGTRLLMAVVLLIIGLKFINLLGNLAAKKMSVAKMDSSMQPFLVSLIKTGLQVLLLITIASMMGIEMTSFIAVVGAASFAVGLALQGSLANFAGGVLLLFLKPFKVGDFIEAAGHKGSVREIQVFHTILNTPDNKKIIIPNASLSNASTINFSAYPTRRIDFTFGVGYQDDLETVKGILRDIAESHPLIMEDPPPQIVLGAHGDHALLFYMRVWCQRTDYWPIYFEVMEKVKGEFDKAGINIPYPQMDVHMIKE